MPATRRTLCLAALLACAGVRAAPPRRSADERRVALVIGNSAYRIGPLKNPVADAQAVAWALRDLGFEVVLVEDGTLREMIEALRRFSHDARSAGVRLVYYAGHGVQLKGRNYLLPTDTEIGAEEQMPARSVDLNELIERLVALQQGINIVILDACRNNPFSGTEVLGPDGRRLRLRGPLPDMRPLPGLAPVEAPMGSVVAFATAPGGVALDNPKERHSLYTKHLLEQLQTPGLPIEMLFKQVRLNVARETGRMQVPWESSSLTGDFCFKPAPGGGCLMPR
jgi:uncharacterized caspase-like protein